MRWLGRGGSSRTFGRASAPPETCSPPQGLERGDRPRDTTTTKDLEDDRRGDRGTDRRDPAELAGFGDGAARSRGRSRPRFPADLFAPARRRILAPLGLLPLLHVPVCSWLDPASLAYFYRYGHDFEDPRIVASELSPYQRVDIVQEGDGPDASCLSLGWQVVHIVRGSCRRRCA